MIGPNDMRRERIERLLMDLKYEVVRGVMEREIEPEIHFSQLIPGENGGLVHFEFHVYKGSGNLPQQNVMPKLRVVK
jgi:hypothetical protein